MNKSCSAGARKRSRFRSGWKMLHIDRLNTISEAFVKSVGKEDNYLGRLCPPVP